MVETISTDVFIVGGGSAGLWLAYHLNSEQISCAVCDTSPFAAYASTRNQGWLQSGAFYAARNDLEAAETCAAGYAFIKSYAKDVIDVSIPAYFFFQDPGQREFALKNCQQLGIYANPITASQLEYSARTLTEGSNLEYAIEVKDCVVNTQQLWSRVASDISDGYVQFLSAQGLPELSFTQTDSGWSIDLGTNQIVNCKIIVLACGAYIPTLHRILLPKNQEVRFQTTKVSVLAIKGKQINSLIATPLAPLGPNIVPFNTPMGQGVTICLQADDHPIQNHDDNELPENQRNKHLFNIKEFLPNFGACITQNMPAHFYVCQKIRLANKGSLSRTYIILEDSPNVGENASLVTFYPGKMTAAPIASRACADRVLSLLNSDISTQPRMYRSLQTIAEQPYFDAAEYLLTSNSNVLSFDKS